MNSETTLNTIAASAGDITLQGGLLNVLGWTEKVKYLNITSSMINGGIKGFLFETLKVVSLAYTAAANTTYKFSVTQTINGESFTRVIPYISDSTGADATIASNIVSAFNKLGFQITASGSATPLTFTAITGNATFSLVNVQNTTPTVTATVASQTSTSIAAGSTVDLPYIVTKAAHGLTNGMTIVMTGALGTGLANVNGIWRITYISSSTFSLDGSRGTGSITNATGDFYTIAQDKFGYGADLITAGVTGASSLTLYSLLNVVYGNDVTNLATAARVQNGNSQKLWVSAATVAAPNTPTTNFTAFVVRLLEIANAHEAGGVVADAEVVAKV